MTVPIVMMLVSCVKVTMEMAEMCVLPQSVVVSTF